MSKLETYRKLLAEQQRWIEERGGDLAGYLNFYPRRSTENVQAIYAADVAQLKHLQARVNKS